MKRYGLKQADITPIREGIKLGVQDLVYIQQSVLDNDFAFIKSMLPDNLPNTAIVIMNGCVITKAGNVYQWTAGNIFYNDMFYTVFAGSIAVSGASVIPKWRINPNPQGAYPRNTVIGDNPAGAVKVNVDEQMELVEGTGIADWNKTRRLEWLRAWKDAKDAQPQMFSLSNFDIALNFDTTGLSKAFTPYEGFAEMNGNNGTLNLKGLSPIGRNPANATFDTVGKTAGAYETTLTASQSGLRAHGHGVNENNNGAHVHNVSVSGGDHSHTMSTSTKGLSTTGSGGENVEAITTSAGKNDSENTSNSGNLTLSGQTQSGNGGHTHNISIQAVADANAIDAHSNLHPVMVLGFMQKKADYNWV